MSDIRCEREDELMAALAEEGLNASLREHADSCPDCAEVLLVDAFFSHEAKVAQAAADPAQPGYLWRQAERLARKERVAKAMRPIALIQRAAGAAAAAMAAIGALVSWPALKGWVGGLQLSSADHLALPAAVSAPVLLLMSGTLAVALVALGLYSQWADS